MDITRRINRLRQRAIQLNKSMAIIILESIGSRIYISTLPLLTLFGGTKFDHYGWKNLKVAGTSSSLDAKSAKREEGTNYLWSFIDLQSARSVLEIGCLTGYRILQKAKLNPDVYFTGVDISQDAIDTARAEAITLGITNVAFECYDITAQDFLEDFKTRRFDVIFSFATLICIHPRKIKRIIRFMLINADQQTLMIEQDNANYQYWPFYLGLPIRNNPNWLRNYKKTCLSVDSKVNLEISRTPVPSDIWDAGGGHCTVLNISRVVPPYSS